LGRQGLQLVQRVIAIAAVALVTAVAIGAWWWWKENAEQLKESAKAAYAEGRRAGAALGERECFARAVTRHSDKSHQTILESVRTNLILRGCLDTSRVETKFCDGVQAKDNVLSHATWAAQSCANLGFTDSYCPQMMGQLAEYCSSQKRAAKL
jgi:hypothetical protein